MTSRAFLEFIMKIAHSLIIGTGLALTGPVSMASAQGTEGHRMLSLQDIKWAPAPPSIPPGAEAAVLYGDPSKDGLFAMRLKFPKGYKIAPHTHPKPEVLTVISGTFRLGMGETADQSKAKAFAPGSFISLSPGMAHFASSDDDNTVVQLNSTGPWTLNYINQADDPRKR
jgi:quercetin dioxygenase-like cupin family protein